MPPGSELIHGMQAQDTPVHVIVGEVALAKKGSPLTCNSKAKGSSPR